MATVNYAEKYAPIFDQRFTQGSLTQGGVNNDFDWIGVQTVKVFSHDLATLNDYTVTGSNRYGVPDELGNSVQEMKVTQDKSFTYTIDAMSEQDTNGTMEAAATLRENIDNVLIPAIDKYRLAAWVSACPTKGSVSGATHVVTATITSANAYESFLSAQEVLDNDLAPRQGRVAYVSSAFYKAIHLDDNFIKKGDMAQQIAINGLVGTIDDVPIVSVPASYLPTGVNFIITNPVASPAPVKLQEFKINFDAPGISGALVEARCRHDCFVLAKKADAIAVCKAA